jgi:hypothetical protein
MGPRPCILRGREGAPARAAPSAGSVDRARALRGCGDSTPLAMKWLRVVAALAVVEKRLSCGVSEIGECRGSRTSGVSPRARNGSRAGRRTARARVVVIHRQPQKPAPQRRAPSRRAAFSRPPAEPALPRFGRDPEIGDVDARAPRARSRTPGENSATPAVAAVVARDQRREGGGAAEARRQQRRGPGARTGRQARPGQPPERASRRSTCPPARPPGSPRWPHGAKPWVRGP